MTNLISNTTNSTPKRPAQKKQNKLGPYNLLQTLGEGEFGKVKLGIHIETGQEVAIKLIRKEGDGSDSRINKVEREISVLKTLNHPYIVKLYNVVETEKYIGIILEYASGGELFEYILAHRYLKEKDAKKFFAQLISSVQYMHRRKIVHRDLKLENLLLDKNRNIIVTDFGFANQFASAADDLMATTCGSPCYAAPELVVNAGLYAGSAVDIWSCGVILYAMLCGFLPFDDDPSNPDSDNINQLYRYILSTNLMFPSHVSADARDLLAKMLVPDPSKRCSLDYIVRHPWLESYRQFLKKDAAYIEMEAAAASRLPTMPDTKSKSNPNVTSSASTSLPRKMTAAGANAVGPTRKTHIPVVARDRFAPVANDKYYHNQSTASLEQPVSNTPKPPSTDQQQKTGSTFRHFSIGRSSATTTTVEKQIHATNAKSSKVPNFISRKPVKKENEATNNDSVITVASNTSSSGAHFSPLDDLQLEKSLSSPTSNQDTLPLSSMGSIRRNQRRGADKFLSFFTGGRASHIPIVSHKNHEDEAIIISDDNDNSIINNTSVVTSNESYHDTTEDITQDDMAPDSAIGSTLEWTSHHAIDESDQHLLRSASEASTIADSIPSSLSPTNQSTTAHLSMEHYYQPQMMDGIRNSTSTIQEDQEGEANASNGSQYDSTSVGSYHHYHHQNYQQLLPAERERGNSISTTSILSEQGLNSSVHSSSIVSFKDAPRRAPLLFNSQKSGSSTQAMRHQQYSNNSHVRIDTGSSIVSSSADGHVDNASLSSAGTCPHPEPSNSNRLTAKYVVSNAMGDGGRKAMAVVRRSIYRKHRSQPPPATQQQQQHQNQNQDTISNASSRSNSQRNSAPVSERNREPLISFAKSRFEETDAQVSQDNKLHARNANAIMTTSVSEVTAAKNETPKKTGKKMMEWIKKKSHGKESKKEVDAQIASKTTKTPTKEPSRSSAQILTRSSKSTNTKKEPSASSSPHPPAAAAKISHSNAIEVPAETYSKKSSKVPAAIHKTRRTVISILAPPSSPNKLTSSSAEAEEHGLQQHHHHHQQQQQQPQKQQEKEDIVVPEKNSICRQNRALSGSETALAELNKKKDSIDERIQIHQGAIDRKALTSQSPKIVIKDIARILHILGIDTTLESSFVLKCCRRKAKSFVAAELLKKQNSTDNDEDDENDAAIDASSASSSGISASVTAATATNGITTKGQDPIYGDASIDNGDEIRFVVEMCRFKNLPGLYIVDIRRLRGNAWAYKFLYHKLIDFLDLGKDNYMQSSK